MIRFERSVFIMDEFNFYNSENDGYRGGFGGYMDPEPAVPGAQLSTGGTQRPSRKKGGAARVVALVLACAIAGGGAGVGGAYLYTKSVQPKTSLPSMRRTGLGWKPLSTPTTVSP